MKARIVLRILRLLCENYAFCFVSWFSSYFNLNYFLRHKQQIINLILKCSKSCICHFILYTNRTLFLFNCKYADIETHFLKLTLFCTPYVTYLTSSIHHFTGALFEFEWLPLLPPPRFILRLV